VLLLAIGCSSASSSSSDWSQYGANQHHTFAASSQINKSNVAKLKEAWSFQTGDTVSGSPAVVGGVVYVGSWDANFYALDAATGALKWKFEADCQKSARPVPMRCLAAGEMAPERTDTDGGLFVSSPTVVGDKIYVGGGKTLYCLSTKDGSLIWKTVLCGKPEAPNCQMDDQDPTIIFSSPAVVGGKVIVGHTVDGKDGYRGAINALDAATGATAWVFEIDPILGADGKPTSANNNRGCGSVWSSGAVDENSNTIYFGTGDCQSDAEPPYHEALLALDIDHGTLKFAFRPRAHDTCDFDFGASPNILDIGGQRLVGVGGKDGTYYALKATTTSTKGELVWSKNVVFGGSSGGFIGSAAFDGKRIYSATAFGEVGSSTVCMPSNPRDTMIQDPSYHAIDASGGSVVWEDARAYSFAPSTVTNGVVFNGVGQLLMPALRAYDADTGDMLWNLQLTGAVNSAAVIVGDTIYFGSGNSFDGAGSAVHAYRLP
jgi:polyvinyl alcohol dehydrogenase (cytochrome)